MPITKSATRPGISWEPDDGTANPFVFNATTTIINPGDVMAWDADNDSGRALGQLNAHPKMRIGTIYTHGTLTVDCINPAELTNWLAPSGPMVITSVGSLVGVAVGDKFEVASRTDADEFVLVAPGLGAANNALADWTAEIPDPELDGEHPINFWRPTPALAHSAQSNLNYGVACASRSIKAVADYEAHVDLPRCPILCSGLVQALCADGVQVGDFLTHSTAAGRTLDRKATTASQAIPVIGRALESAPSGGGLTWCIFDGFYGIGSTQEVYA